MLLKKHQAEECLKREKDRVSHYLHSSSEPKLLEVCSFSSQSNKICLWVLGLRPNSYCFFKSEFKVVHAVFLFSLL